MKKAIISAVVLLTVGVFGFLLGLWTGRSGAVPISARYELIPEIGAVAVGKPELNTATVFELAAIPEIGPELAVKIIDWRKEHGAFLSPQELMNVEGMDSETLASILDRITIGGQ